MISYFSNSIAKILEISREEAARHNCTAVQPEHLLMGLLRIESEKTHEILTDLCLNPDTLKRQLEASTPTNEGRDVQKGDTRLGHIASDIVKATVLEARKLHSPTIEPYHMLLAMLCVDTDNLAKAILTESHLTYERLSEFLNEEGYDKTIARESQHTKTEQVSEMPEMVEEEEFSDIADSDSEDPEDGEFAGEGPFAMSNGQTRTSRQQKTKGGKGGTPNLDKYATDLTQAAADGKLDPVVGREKEVYRLMEILCRRKKNNPVLIGEPGVGKSAIVEGLAQKIQRRDVSPILLGKRILALDLTAVVAGTQYRGQFEQRIKNIITELEASPEIIIFIDEIHTMVGAGSASGTMDAANIMKPALARGQVQCIGATTLDEYRKSIEKDGALERRFQKIIVEPSSDDETLLILNNIKARYEQHHHVVYTDEALQACVRLTKRYITDRAFPDKAIDAMDEVGAKMHLASAKLPPSIAEIEQEIEELRKKKKTAVFNQNFELAASYRDRQAELQQKVDEIRENWASQATDDSVTVTAENVAEVVAMMSGVPMQSIAEDENTQLRGMAERLKSKVIGQDKAIEKVVKAIQRNRLGLHSPNRPIGAFMFLGPTGVGKTYLAQKLAEELFGSADSLIRIDMSEYNESFNTSRLVGAPPGYVGYDEGGQLTEKVRRHPYSIVLLDEIEKAHQNVYNTLLQMLDEGRLTDGNGRLIDFRNTIIVMTSNAGTKQLKDFGRGVGFQAGGAYGINMDDRDREHARSIIQKALSKQFSPEFLNRLDDIITFDQLDMEAIKSIIALELRPLNERIEQLGYKLNISDEALAQIAEKGYDVQFGARPLKRALQTYVEDEVCERILEGGLKPGDTITIAKSDDQ